MEKEKGFIFWIEDSGLKKILAILATAYGVTYALLYWLEKKVVTSFTNHYEIWAGLWSLVIIGIILSAIYPIYVSKIKSRRDAEYLGATRIILHPREVLVQEISNCNTLRVFASLGDSAKTILIELGKNGLLKRNLNVQVLLRSIKDDQDRERELKNQMERWKTDLCDIYDVVSVKFGIHYSPVMLAGYILDEEIAMLAWYSRFKTPNVDGRYRSPSNPPLIYLSKNDQNQNLLLQYAIDTFNCHFNNGLIK